MPTAKPRILVTLEPNVYETLKKLSAHRKRPISVIVREVVDMVHEPYQRLNDLFDGVERKREEITLGEGEIREGLLNAFNDVDLAARAMNGIAREIQLDFYNDLVAATELSGDASDGEVGDGAIGGPPSTNRGVRSPRSGSNGHSAPPPPTGPRKPRKRSSNG